ncbi:MAG: NIF family HAD-type phosphatase [Chitinophagales bacterium]
MQLIDNTNSPKMKPQKITLLDLGGVVFQSTGTSNEKINWEIIHQLNHKYGRDLYVGVSKFPDFMGEYNELTQQSLLGEEFFQLLFNTLKINTELIEFIRKDSEIVIVSDHYREAIEYISKRYAFDTWAIHQIYSFDYKIVKSNPLFFKKLLEQINEYEKESMVFIDDSPHKIESAAKNGIRGILFESNEQVKREYGG